MPDKVQTLEERKIQVIDAAFRAIEKNPDGLRAVLEQLYDMAQTDFERAYTTHQRSENGIIYTYMKRAHPVWNPEPFKPGESRR